MSRVESLNNGNIFDFADTTICTIKKQRNYRLRQRHNRLLYRSSHLRWLAQRRVGEGRQEAVCRGLPQLLMRYGCRFRYRSCGGGVGLARGAVRFEGRGSHTVRRYAESFFGERPQPLRADNQVCRREHNPCATLLYRGLCRAKQLPRG